METACRRAKQDADREGSRMSDRSKQKGRPHSENMSFGPILSLGGLFVVLGLTWAAMPPILCRYYVGRLSDGSEACAEAAEEALRRMGPAAMNALRQGMKDGPSHARLRCAAVLAELGDGDGEAEIRRIARNPRLDAGLRRAAGERMARLWKLRAGPAAAARLDSIRARAARGFELSPAEDADRVLGELDALVADYPGYAEAFVARGEMRAAVGLLREAADDAYAALDLEDGHPGALLLLARVYRWMGFLDLALQAVEEMEAGCPSGDENVKKFRQELEKSVREAAERRRRARRMLAPLI
jgi:tetratricopeptide (TPR) repeat protein